jgi:hypothetical protein
MYLIDVSSGAARRVLSGAGSRRGRLTIVCCSRTRTTGWSRSGPTGPDDKCSPASRATTATSGRSGPTGAGRRGSRRSGPRAAPAGTPQRHDRGCVGLGPLAAEQGPHEDGCAVDQRHRQQPEQHRPGDRDHVRTIGRPTVGLEPSLGYGSNPSEGPAPGGLRRLTVRGRARGLARPPAAGRAFGLARATRPRASAGGCRLPLTRWTRGRPSRASRRSHCEAASLIPFAEEP